MLSIFEIGMDRKCACCRYCWIDLLKMKHKEYGDVRCFLRLLQCYYCGVVVDLQCWGLVC